MENNKTNINKVCISNLDEWLNSTGFLCPTNELELVRFNKLYADYDYKLKSASINLQSIMRNHVCPNLSPFVFTKGDNLESEINELTMAARKGSHNIPQHIIEKMKKHHIENDD